MCEANVLSASRMRWVFASLCSLALVPWLTGAAQAQSPAEVSREHEAPPAFLSVTRDEGAESCPDTDALRAHVDRLRGHQPTSEPSAYRVRFSYRGGVFRADIKVGVGGGARVLRDRRATCASLEQATALTLALLLDSDASELPPEKVEPEPSRSSHAPSSRPARTTKLRPSANTEIAPRIWRLSLGGGALFGVVQPVAPTLQAELGIGVNRFRTGIGVLWMPPQTHEFGPGQLRRDVAERRGAHVPHGGAQRAGALRAVLGIYAGLLKVQADRNTRNDSATRLGWQCLSESR